MDFFVHAPVRLYKFADSLAVQKADDIVQSVERDLAELDEYGITAAIIINYKARRDAFAHAPTDYMLSGAMMIATQTKNEKHTILERKIRRTADRVRIKLGEGHGVYQALGVALLSRQPSYELVRTGRSVVATCTTYLAQLTSEGISALMLAEITTLSDDLDDLIDAKILAVKNRDIAVFERITLGNELYELMVNFAAKGKSCWYGINEAKYNDYIIYAGGETPANQQIAGTVDAESVVNTSVTNVDDSTILTLRNTGLAPLHFFFAATPTDTTGPAEVVVQAAETLARTALQLGYSAQMVRFNVYNPAHDGGSYVVEW